MSELLDRSRAYGTVVPPEDGCHYAQDGKYFGPDFRRVYAPSEESPKADAFAAARAAKAAKAAAVAPETEAVPQPVAALYEKPPWRRGTPKASFAPKDGKGKRKYPRAERNQVKPGVAPRPADATKSPEINLAAWAIGEQKYLFAQVRDAVRTRFNVVVNQEHDALGVLIREKVVAAGDIPGYGQSTDPGIAGKDDPTE